VTAFDPAAATAAYLAQMSPAAQAKATAYTHGREWMLLADWLVTIVVTWLIVRTGALTALRDMWQRRRRRPMLATFVTGLGYFALSFVLGLPWAIYSGWWFEKTFGMTSQPLGGWFVDQLIQSAFSVVIGSVFLVLLYLFLRVARRTWWLWAAGLTGVFFAFLMFVQPLVLEPMLNKYTPAPPGPVRDAVVALGHKTGTPTDKIFVYNGSKQSNRYTANVAGLFGTARVAMSDVMFKKGADLAEVRGVVGHEMGHYVHNHGLWLMGGFTLIALFVFWLTDRLFPYAAQLFGARGVGDIADPAGVAVLFAVISTVMLILTPVTNTITRVAEADADSFSLQYANEPDGLSEALIKTADYRAPSPSVAEEVIFYDHPSVSRRIRKAMNWKAKHLPPPAPCTDNADHSVQTCGLPEARLAAPTASSAPKAQ
jgi:STE24 endopeptidase